MDIDVFPNSLEYWGPNGMVLFRNIQIRWTPIRSDRTELALALERPAPAPIKASIQAAWNGRT